MTLELHTQASAPTESQALLKNSLTTFGMIPNLQFGTSNADAGVKASIRGVTSSNFTY